MKKKILKLHRLLLEKYGIPPREIPPPLPLDALIATILSQNTNDTNSYKAYLTLRERYPIWEQMANVTADQIEALIRVAGLAKQKASAIYQVLLIAAQQNFSFSYLADWDERTILEFLTGINGVGLKTASCVLLFSLQKNVCPVDTHVHRVLNRIGIVSTGTPDKTFEKINGNLAEGIAHSFHTNLIRHGRAICKAQHPLCGICPLTRMCTFKEKNTQGRGELQERNFMLLDHINIQQNTSKS